MRDAFGTHRHLNPNASLADPLSEGAHRMRIVHDPAANPMSCSTFHQKGTIMAVKQEKLRPEEKANPAPPAGLRKVQFGAIAKPKQDSRSSYPVLPDPQGRYAAIAARIIERSVQVEALAGALDVDKAELKTLATPFYFTHASGKLDVPSSVGVHCSNGEVLITFQNRYGKLDSEEPLLPILGEQTGRFFRQAFTLEIAGDKLPAEQVQPLLDELQGLFAKYQASEALKVKEGIKPVPDFHTLRHTALSPEQNLAVDQVCPIIAMVKAKAQS